VDVARGNQGRPFMIPATELTPPAILPMPAHRGAYYLRLSVHDHPGVLASLTSIFHEFGVSVARLVQYENRGDGQAMIIMLTHEASEEDMNIAVERITALESITAHPCLIRMEAI
jgi:homoserine dehydrogenase